MPEYYTPHNWKNRGEIVITYKPFWRNIRILKKFPFWVGNKVTFNIRFEKPGEKNIYATQVIHHKLNNVVVEEFNIEEISNKIVACPISGEGDVKFSLGIANYSLPSDELIMTANVQSKDRWWLGCAGLFIGGIISFILSIVLGLIEIDKFWHIINPLWK